MSVAPPGLVATPRAVFSLRRMTLADGPEAGLDCLALSTGGGLDAWLLAGRSLDIGPLWWRGRQLGWMPPQGFAHAALRRAEEEDGQGFGRMIGGFLVTCGLSHIRQPMGGEPLHGRFPYTPARVTRAEETADGALDVEAEVVEARLGGAVLVLRRRISAVANGTALRIRDEVENAGHGPAPHAILYHMNLGWPLLAPGTRVELDGRDLAGSLQPGAPDAVRGPATCRPAGNGVARIISPEGMAMTLRFDPATLPLLQLWHDLRPRVAILSLEPCSTAIGDAPPELGPGERRSYGLDIEFEGS